MTEGNNIDDTSVTKIKKKSNIRFEIKGALYLIEWSHDDLLLRTEIKTDGNSNLYCTISTYLKNVPININVLDKDELTYLMKLYDQEIRLFLVEEENKIKSRINLYKFLTILNIKEKRRILLWKLQSNIHTLALGDPTVRIVTLTHNFKDSINCINIDINSKWQAIFLVIHTTNLFLINKLTIIIIKRLFAALSFFIKIIRIITIIFASIGITMPILYFSFNLPMDTLFILTSTSIALFSLVVFFSSSLLKSRISKVIINHLLSK